ncbi:DNA-binding transcriptional regulator, AcrR family [Pseudarcicella hirudinis]|uniref:DNA-binding transcriptional regulator, AcrR family n=1 Tax=Pseudarcicella hirudinis TaxID=1079859 RepID=A0A1I5RJD9_9BACT|nr:TetR/AcrR family transcriptional regulator [Pseudarcicella hirudinis]SFP58689.1 DNA-binding transcriptional regulator, AcrR family [Pseudarcicella hirudinis]
MDKRKKILEAALKLFVALGFHGTPTSKIAQEAGVANGTLFHYFPTKDDLILGLYTDIKIRMTAFVNENAKPEDTFKATMKGQYLASLYWALDHKTEFSFKQQFHNSPFHLLLNQEEIEKQLKPHFDMLRKGIEDKIIKPLPVDYIHTLISSHTFGLNQYLTSNEFSTVKQHQLISDTFELLWDMIKEN